MGYLPSSSTHTVYAYLTQKGRYNLLFSSATASTVSYFSLHDDDINYRVTSKKINSDYNKLTRGFVPDITGDDDDCIKSVSQAYILGDSDYLVYTSSTT
jgi:hypothetical protein